MARTQGTFQQVYEAAREFMADGHGTPHDPVVRRCEGGIWMLESSMNDVEGCDFEISLNDFISYWWEELDDPDRTPAEYDIREFAANYTQNEAVL